MANLRCESALTVPGAPADVFPWLLEADKVPRWMSDLDAYEPLDGDVMRVGSRVRQVMTVSGHKLEFELKLTRLEPPVAAEHEFAGSGFSAANRYGLADAGDGTQVRWVIAGKTTSFSARLLAPMVQSRLQAKLETDLQRLREVLA